MMFLSSFLMTLLALSGVFLIGLILLQRGRGGGLAGAFGGMGGQSAFGTKAGDVFTRITIGVASAWILLCALSVVTLYYTTRVGQRTDSSIFGKEDTADSTKKDTGKGDLPANELPALGTKSDKDKSATEKSSVDESKKNEVKKNESEDKIENTKQPDAEKKTEPAKESKEEASKPVEQTAVDTNKPGEEAEKKSAEPKPEEKKPDSPAGSKSE